MSCLKKLYNIEPRCKVGKVMISEVWATTIKLFYNGCVYWAAIRPPLIHSTEKGHTRIGSSYIEIGWRVTDTLDYYSQLSNRALINFIIMLPVL